MMNVRTDANVGIRTNGCRHKRMSERTKKAITRYREKGYGYKRISKVLDISEYTIKSFCKRSELAGVRSTAHKKNIFCPNCGQPVKSKCGHRPRRFCCAECRQLWWNTHPEKIKKKAFYDFSCAYCGAKFTAYGNNHRKYCSHECYIRDRFGTPGDMNNPALLQQ